MLRLITTALCGASSRFIFRLHSRLTESKRWRRNGYQATCASVPWTVIPSVVTDVQGFIATGQFRSSDQLLDFSNSVSPAPCSCYWSLCMTAVLTTWSRGAAARLMHTPRTMSCSMTRRWASGDMFCSTRSRRLGSCMPSCYEFRQFYCRSGRWFWAMTIDTKHPAGCLRPQTSSLTDCR